MDNFIVRWYNQNRRIIWIVILTIVGVIALIQTLNTYYKNNPEDVNSSTNNSTTTYNANNYSIITQEKTDVNATEKSIDLIGYFFKYCNSGQIEYAYNLLSTECKQELYPTIEEFKTEYYNRIFTEQKSYNSMLWITTSGRHTYRIEITEDLLATGGQKDNMPIEDYYTIVYENGTYKLNINRFVWKEDINTAKTQSNISVNIISKSIYMDYELYEIKVQNNTGSKLIFNTKENTDSIYIQDANELKYIAFLNEIPHSELEISSGSIKTFQIKFNRGYKPNINIQKIVFENINNKGKEETIEIEL